MHLAEDHTYWFQQARTLFKVQVERENSFWHRMTTNRDEEEE